jgi:hypothetical protein
MLKDILASLIMGAGGFSKSYGEGLQQRQKTKDEYMNDLNKMYTKSMMERSDPMYDLDKRYKEALIYRTMHPNTGNGNNEWRDYNINVQGNEQEVIPIDLSKDIVPVKNNKGEYDLIDITNQIKNRHPNIDQQQALEVANKYVNALNQTTVAWGRDKKLEDIINPNINLFAPTNKAVATRKYFPERFKDNTKPPPSLDDKTTMVINEYRKLYPNATDEEIITSAKANGDL